MATARKLPSGNYRVRLFVGMEDGKRKYKSFTAPTKKEAERQAAVYEYEKKKKQENGMTIGEAIQTYIKNNSNVLSPASIRKYDGMRKNNYKGIEDKYADEITSQELQSFINKISASHSPKTVSCIYGLLSAALKSADPTRVFSIKLPEIRGKDISVPSDAQVKRFLSEAGSNGMECAFALGAILGLRRSEISPLTWQDIDGDMLRINKAMVQNEKGEWVTKWPKTEAGERSLQLPGFLKEKILQEKKENAKDTDRIFQFTPNAITKAFGRATKRAGIKFRFHDLRHYNASIMLALEIPDKYAMKRMGHATPNMLRKVYQHLLDEKEVEVAERVNLYMSKMGE